MPFLNNKTTGELSSYAKSIDFLSVFLKLASSASMIKYGSLNVFNNSSSAEIQFLVIDDGDLVLDRVLNYPNPFTSYTEFWFQHNKPFEPLDVRIQVFTVSGKMVWSTVQTVTTDGFLSRDVSWDGRDQFGALLGKGVYVYKISVKSTLSNKVAEKFEKLVILK